MVLIVCIVSGRCGGSANRLGGTQPERSFPPTLGTAAAIVSFDTIATIGTALRFVSLMSPGNAMLPFRHRPLRCTATFSMLRDNRKSF